MTQKVFKMLNRSTIIYSHKAHVIIYGTFKHYLKVYCLILLLSETFQKHYSAETVDAYIRR